MSESRASSTAVIAIALAAVGGATFGYWLGSTSSRSDTSQQEAGHALAESTPDAWRSLDDRKSQSAVTARDGQSSPAVDPRDIAAAAAPRDEDRLIALVDAAARTPGAYQRERVLRSTLEDLAALDPQLALRKAQALGPLAVPKLVPAVIGVWAEHDIDAAADAAFLLESAGLRMAAAREILSRRSDLSAEARRSIAARLAEPEAIEWLLLESEADPSAASARLALAEASGMAGRFRRHDRLERIAQQIALKSPTAALAMADDLSDPRDRATFQASVAAVWAESDPVAASQWLESESARLSWNIVTAVAAPYTRSDPQSALAWARRVDPNGRRGVWSAVIATLAETDPVTAVERAIAADIGGGRANAASIAMAFLARKDPVLAASYLDRLTVTTERSQAAAQIAIEMARQGDPARALDWLASQGPAAAQQGRTQIAMNWVQNDPEAALRFGDRLPAAERSDWQRVVVDALVNVDPEAALELLRARRADAHYPQLLATAARTLAAREPDLAIDLSDDLSDARLRDDVLGRAMPQLARRDPRDAARQLARIDNDAARANATQLVAQIWAQQDPDAALDWVRSMPSGPQRDQGLAALVTGMPSARRMEAAIGRIQQDHVRRQAVFNAAMTLAQRGESDEARALVFRHPLDPGMMQALEARLAGAPESR